MKGILDYQSDEEENLQDEDIDDAGEETQFKMISVGN